MEPDRSALHLINLLPLNGVQLRRRPNIFILSAKDFPPESPASVPANDAPPPQSSSLLPFNNFQRGDTSSPARVLGVKCVGRESWEEVERRRLTDGRRSQREQVEADLQGAEM